MAIRRRPGIRRWAVHQMQTLSFLLSARGGRERERGVPSPGREARWAPSQSL